MKKLVIGLGLILALGVAAVIAGAVYTSSIRCTLDPNIIRVRNLQTAIRVYEVDADAANDGRPKPYPDSLQDLVTYGLLTQTDLKKLTQGDLHYYRPVGEPSEKTVILELRKEKGTVFGEWSGHTYIKMK